MIRALGAIVVLVLLAGASDAHAGWGAAQRVLPQVVLDSDLAVAPDGSAVLALITVRGVRVRTAPPGGPFGPSRAVAGSRDAESVFAGARPGGGGLVAFTRNDGTFPEEDVGLRESPCCASLRVARVRPRGGVTRPRTAVRAGTDVELAVLAVTRERAFVLLAETDGDTAVRRVTPGGRLGRVVRVPTPRTLSGQTLQVRGRRAVVGLVGDSDGGEFAVARQDASGRFGRPRTIVRAGTFPFSDTARLVPDGDGGHVVAFTRSLPRSSRGRVVVVRAPARARPRTVYRSTLTRYTPSIDDLSARGDAIAVSWTVATGRSRVSRLAVRPPGAPMRPIPGPRWGAGRVAALGVAVTRAGRVALSATLAVRGLGRLDQRVAFPTGPGTWAVRQVGRTPTRDDLVPAFADDTGRVRWLAGRRVLTRSR